MTGRRGLVMGVANDHSIAWGIARVLYSQGAEIALTYQGEAFGRRVKPLAEKISARLVLPCDVEDEASLAATFDVLDREWGRLDFLVHAIAYSDRNELKGRYVDTSRDNFNRTLLISCYSFTEVARRAVPLMSAKQGKGGGALLTLSYFGAERVMPNYNVMGVAKAALEASVRYLAVDLGQDDIRVNAISAGPVRTLAGAAVGEGRMVFKWSTQHSALKKNVDIEQVGRTALYLLSDLSSNVTGEILHVDGGYHVVGMPRSEDLKIFGLRDNAENGNDSH
jgi:enoyl-[acyl-carrier protein] reductase I